MSQVYARLKLEGAVTEGASGERLIRCSPSREVKSLFLCSLPESPYSFKMITPSFPATLILSELATLSLSEQLIEGEAAGEKEIKKLDFPSWYRSRLKEIKQRVEARDITPDLGWTLFEVLKYALRYGEEELKNEALEVAKILMSALRSEAEMIRLKPGEIRELTGGVFVKLEGDDLVIYTVIR